MSFERSVMITQIANVPKEIAVCPCCGSALEVSMYFAVSLNRTLIAVIPTQIFCSKLEAVIINQTSKDAMDVIVSHEVVEWKEVNQEIIKWAQELTEIPS